MENPSGEEDKTFRIVEVIPLGGAVEIFPVEKLVPANEIDLNIFVQVALIDVCSKGFISEGHLNAFPQILERKSGLLDHPVIGHDQYHLASERVKEFGKGACPIRQPSCFSK